MQKPYLYLEKREYAATWVSGGKIPIRLASCYRKDERNGIYTPDENIVDELSDNSLPAVQRQGFKTFLSDAPFLNDMVVIDRGYDTIIIMPKEWLSQVPGNFKTITYEDGYIPSFCREKSKIIKNGLGKKICVQINDIFKLKKMIDKQLNCIGEYQRCKYTKTHQRNHFLKSKDDEWQQEYRIFWKGIKHCPRKGFHKEFWVDIPKNTAKIISY